MHAMKQMIVAVVLFALPAAFAQCPMPALPADTQTADCPVAGADLADDATCTIACVVRNNSAQQSHLRS